MSRIIKPTATIIGQTIKLKLSPEEIQRFKIDSDFAKQKLQEAKDASLAKEMDNKINALGKENEAPAFLAKKKLQEATDAALAKVIDEETNLSDAQNEPEAIFSPAIDKQDAYPFKWSHEAILLLIEEYRLRASDFTSGRMSQKRVWDIICNVLVKKGHAVTAPQCMSKYNGLKKTYKSVKDHNGQSGNATRTWAYFDIMDGLLKKKPFMAPLATTSSTGKRSLTESESSTDSRSGNTTPKRCAQVSNKDVVAVLQKSKALAEENRERRHQEKMVQRDKSLALLGKILSALEK